MPPLPKFYKTSNVIQNLFNSSDLRLEVFCDKARPTKVLVKKIFWVHTQWCIKHDIKNKDYFQPTGSGSSSKLLIESSKIIQTEVIHGNNVQGLFTPILIISISDLHD